MTNEEQAIFRSILECPFDDAPKLVYADWLEECGRTIEADNVRRHSAYAKPEDYRSPERQEDKFRYKWFYKRAYHGPFNYQLNCYEQFFEENFLELFRSNPITKVYIWGKCRWNSSCKTYYIYYQFGEKFFNFERDEFEDVYEVFSQQLVNYGRSLVGLSKLYEDAE